MTYFEKNEQKQFFPMFSMLNAIGGISNVADFTTPCVNIADSAFSQLSDDSDHKGNQWLSPNMWIAGAIDNMSSGNT